MTIKQFGAESTYRNWPIWKTIKIGTGFASASELLAAIGIRGLKIGDWADDMLVMPEFVINLEEIELDLVVVSASDIGFENGARRDQIYKRIEEFGLEVCPCEVGPQLYLQYDDKADGEILIGMNPIVSSIGVPRVFYIARRGSEIRLRSYFGRPDIFWGTRTKWVFVRPRR